MNWNRRTAAWAALALVVVTNAVALAGAALNRAGEPDSTLHLTERELTLPYAFRTGRTENSGVSLPLRWRTLQHAGGASANAIRAYDGGNAPVWLGLAKMKALGFAPPAADDARALFQRQSARDALVVLEMDGPARAEALRRAEEGLQELLAQHATDKPDARRAALPDVEDVSRGVAAERTSESRLFAVDAGLDQAELRARYPDRTRYAIMRARIAPRPRMDGFEDGGAIDGLDVQAVNVPLAWRAVFETAPSRRALTDDTRLHFDATLALGQRLEPWLVSAARRAWPAPDDAAAAH